MRELKTSELMLCNGAGSGSVIQDGSGNVKDATWGNYNYLGYDDGSGFVSKGFLGGNFMDGIRGGILGALGGAAGGAMAGAKLATAGGEIGGIIAEVVGYLYGAAVGAVGGGVLGAALGTTKIINWANLLIGPVLGGNI